MMPFWANNIQKLNYYSKEMEEYFSVIPVTTFSVVGGEAALAVELWQYF